MNSDVIRQEIELTRARLAHDRDALVRRIDEARTRAERWAAVGATAIVVVAAAIWIVYAATRKARQDRVKPLAVPASPRTRVRA
jgi:succinate dehydrogenase hydrophobic anchor subunit